MIIKNALALILFKFAFHSKLDDFLVPANLLTQNILAVTVLILVKNYSEAMLNTRIS